MAAMIRVCCLVTVLGVVAQPLAAQTSRSDPTDTQAWLGAQLSLNLPKRFEADLQYRLRLVDNASSVRGSFYTAELSRTIAPHLSLLSSYRLGLVDGATYHRLGVGTEVSGKVGDTGIGLRSIVQYQQQNFAGNDDGSSDTDAFVRTRVQVKRAVTSSLDVYASTEPYFKLGDTGSGSVIDNWRNTVGLKWQYASGRKVDLFYIYRPDYGKSYNRTFHIVGMTLDFRSRLGASKKKTKKGAP